VLGVATLLFGLVPQFLPATWAVVGYSLILGTFGPILKLPQLLMDLSPFEHPAQLPLEPFTVTPLVVLLLVAVVTGAVGITAYRRRDVNT
jgi:ABC-2 type transport system permease protein